MNDQHQIWVRWANRLHGWGLNSFAATMFEATSPLRLAAAQLVYIGQPLLAGLLPERQLVALASLLEDEHEAEAFIRSLREQAE